MTQKASELVSEGDIVVKSGGGIHLQASDVRSDESISLTARDRVVLDSATERSTKSEAYSKAGVDGVAFSHTRSSVGVGVSATAKGSETHSATQHQRGTRLMAHGDIEISAKDSVEVNSSTVQSGEDVTIESDKIRVGAKANHHRREASSKQAQIKSTVVVGNAWVETAMQLADSVEEASESDDAQSGAQNAWKVYSRARKARKTVNSAAQSAGAASTFGFYAGVNVESSIQNQDTTLASSTSQGSSVFAQTGDIGLTAADTVSVHGSALSIRPRRYTSKWRK